MKKYSIFYFSLILALTACGGEDEEQRVLRPVRYGKISQTGIGDPHTFSGTSRSSKEANLSFRVAGVVQNIQVKVGDEVQAGTLVAQLDATDYRVQLQQALADLKHAQTQINSSKAQLVSSQSNYQRVEKLYENNSLPLSDFEQAKTNYEAAQSQYEAALAQVAAAQQRVESAQNQVSYAQLTAPFFGVVTEKMVEENEIVNSGTPVLTLNTEGQPEVEVGIPEAFISKIKNGQKVDIRFSTLSGQNFKGVVSEVGFSSDGSTTYPVRVQIMNPSEEIRPGMAANVTFYFQPKSTSKSLLMAPVQAVAEGANQSRYVFLLKKEKDHYLVKKQAIEVGELLPSGFEVKKGLKEGDLVATAGLKSLLDGMQVRLMEENLAKQKAN